MIFLPKSPAAFSLLFLLCFCRLSDPAMARADEPLFQLSVANSNQKIFCEKVRLDPGSFRCKKGEVTYRYQTDAIETVSYNGERIYPYDTSLELTEDDLYTRDCDYLIETLKCPLMLENDPTVFILVGTMYEKGICTRQNIQKAYTYYRKAGKPGMKKYADLRKRSG